MLSEDDEKRVRQIVREEFRALLREMTEAAADEDEADQGQVPDTVK